MAASTTAGCVGGVDGAGAGVAPPATPVTSVAAATTSMSPSTTVPTTTTTSSTTTSTTTTTTTTTTTIPEPLSRIDWGAVDDSLGRSLGGVAAVSAAVVVDGQVRYRWAQGQRVPGEQALPEHRFRLASLSKLLTAAVVLQLVEEGRIGLDEPVGQLVADQLGIESIDATTAAITPRRLLSHTAGFSKDWARYFGGGLGRDWRLNASSALAAGSSGSNQFVYSNTNYVIAGVLIEALTGQFYDFAVAERLFEPLGIAGPRLGATTAVAADEVLHRSDTNRSYMEALGPAGAWVATADEVALILDALDPGSRSWHPISDELLALMATPVSPGPLPGGGYGLGVMRAADGSMGHTGSIEETRTMAMTRPDGITWVLLVNGERPDSSSRLQAIMDGALAAAAR